MYDKKCSHLNGQIYIYIHVHTLYIFISSEHLCYFSFFYHEVWGESSEPLPNFFQVA